MYKSAMIAGMTCGPTSTSTLSPIDKDYEGPGDKSSMLVFEDTEEEDASPPRYGSYQNHPRQHHNNHSEDNDNGDDDDDDDDEYDTAEFEDDDQYPNIGSLDRGSMASSDAVELVEIERWTVEHESQGSVFSSNGSSFDPQLSQITSVDCYQQQRNNNAPRQNRSATRTDNAATDKNFTLADRGLRSASALVQQLLEQITLHDSPPVNDVAGNAAAVTKALPNNDNKLPDKPASTGLPTWTSNASLTSRVSRQRHDAVASIASSGLMSSHGSFDTADALESTTESSRGLADATSLHPSVHWVNQYYQRHHGQAESKMGHVALAAMCDWTLDAVQGRTGPTLPITTQQPSQKAQNTPSIASSESNTNSDIQNQRPAMESGVKAESSKSEWKLKSIFRKKNKSSSRGIVRLETVDSAAEENRQAVPAAEVIRASVLTSAVGENIDEERADGSTQPEPNTGTRHPSPNMDGLLPHPTRLQMFGSEYARYLSTGLLAPTIRGARFPHKSASSRYGPFSSRRRSSGVYKPATTKVFTSWNLEDAEPEVLTGAIVDICITNGADTPPPKGYYRISQTTEGDEFRALKAGGSTSPRRNSCTFINVKKEPNWDRAAQRPCVTALTVIFPDRQEFVPPGFCVVREHRPRKPSQTATPSQNATSSGGSVDADKNAAHKELPANFNQGGEERVFLCFRRSREGNPITGMLPLQPALNDSIPDGYTVMERSPRNFVASLNPAYKTPVFLAYRQRLANLEPLRPLPLVISVQERKNDPTNDNTGNAPPLQKKPQLKAYYCTGGTVVPSDVGRFHVMDRSTHSLLSPSSVTNRLSLIELSRRRSMPRLVPGEYAGSEASGTPRPGGDAMDQSSHGDIDQSVASSNAHSQVAPSLASSLADFPKDVNSSFSSFGSASFPLDQSSVMASTTDDDISNIPTDILSALPPEQRHSTGYYPTLYDSDLRESLDAMNFIPVVETATPTNEVVSQRLLQARTCLLTPILTACYQRHGGAALQAVEGLTSILQETEFFSDDVDWSSKTSSMRLTLLDLAVQVVCDVATAGSQETTFGACVEFIETAVRYCQGHLNTRTTGYILRFYLFVFYFGASVPGSSVFSDGAWGSPRCEKGISGHGGLSLLYDPRNGGETAYIPGGAPQLSALGLQELITFTMTRLQRVCLNAPKDSNLEGKEGVEIEPLGHFMDGILSSLIDGAVHRVDVANFTQLAVHQIHRSGGSELFWHDMMTSCGAGLFGNAESINLEGRNIYMMTFAILANLVKVSTGKIRSNSQTLELRPRDVSSKLLALELILHFLKQFRDEQQDWVDPVRKPKSCQTVTRCVETIVFAVRRLIVPCLLANTKSSLEDPRVFQRLLSILTVLWSTPLYRDRMKGEMGMLIEHFVLRFIRLGPQLTQSRLSKRAQSGHEELSCPLLHQQLDLMKELTKWFSRDPKITMEMYLNYDTDISSQMSGPTQLLPGTHLKIFRQLCAGLCSLAEQCSDTIGEQIKESQSLSSPKDSSKPKALFFSEASQDSKGPDGKDGKVTEMTSVREGARRLRKASIEAIVQVLKCLARTAAIATGREFYALVSSWSNPLEDDDFEIPEIETNPSDESCDSDRSKSGGVLNYWRNEMEVHRKAKHSAFQVENDSGLLNTITLETAFEIAKKKSVKKAIDYLIACNVLSPSPRDIASFLRIHKDKLDQGALGSYLGEGGIDGNEVEYWNLVRFSYFRAISFDGLNVEEGLRHFLTNSGFQLPGEAQKIDRIMSAFAQCYWEDNAGDNTKCPFKDQDTVFLLSFAIIMLNTDLHKSTSSSGKSRGGSKYTRKRISKVEFLKNFSGIESGEDLTREYLSAIYDSIEADPIVLSNDDLVEGKSNTDPIHIRNRQIKSMLDNVRSADALLRGLSVHDFKWASVQDFRSSLEYEGADALCDLTRSCISETWHQFHGVVNTALETAHLDPEGMENCIDLLQYALCITICLDMPVERTAFLNQLGRFKAFEKNQHSRKNHPFWLSNNDGRQLLLENPALDRAIAGPLDDDSKLKALVQVHETSAKLHSALAVDIKVRQEMARAIAPIVDGEFLLNDPARSFIRQGDLKKKSARSGRLVEYRYFLFSDALIYAKKLDDDQEQYKIHEELPLHLMKVVDWFPPSGKDLKKAFQVHHPRKTFMVYCSSIEERRMWVKDIRVAMEREIHRKVEMEAARMAAAFTLQRTVAAKSSTKASSHVSK